MRLYDSPLLACVFLRAFVGVYANIAKMPMLCLRLNFYPQHFHRPSFRVVSPRPLKEGKRAAEDTPSLIHDFASSFPLFSPHLGQERFHPANDDGGSMRHFVRGELDHWADGLARNWTVTTKVFLEGWTIMTKV